MIEEISAGERFFRQPDSGIGERRVVLADVNGVMLAPDQKSAARSKRWAEAIRPRLTKARNPKVWAWVS